MAESKDKKSDNKVVTKVADSEKAKVIQTVMDNIKKDHGAGSIMKLGEATKVNVDAIPTGSLMLDLALGVGGVPRGRVIEIYGPESSGKTTLAIHAIAEAQKNGGIAAIIDAEIEYKTEWFGLREEQEMK